MRLLVVLFILIASQFTSVARALSIHAAEIGIGKFHRHDNSLHNYATSNAWVPFILPENADLTTPKVIENRDHSLTIFFSTLTEFLQTLNQVAADHSESIVTLDINAHGIPGGMWFPVDDEAKASLECKDWREAATAPDEENYKQYYSATTKKDMNEILLQSQGVANYECVSGLPEWQNVISSIPSLAGRFSDQAILSILSCTVGMGSAGAEFNLGLAAALFGKASRAEIRSIVQLGLGDWSMPEGLGFWNYLNPEQFLHDNQIYPVDREDREIMQRGTVRVVTGAAGDWASSLVENQPFLNFTNPGPLSGQRRQVHEFTTSRAAPPTVRIPGTQVRAALKQ
jgi:hypothetical protein